MAISFRCVKEDCRKLLSAPDDWPGRRIECPVCHTPQGVPGESGRTGVAIEAGAAAGSEAGATPQTDAAGGTGATRPAVDPRFARHTHADEPAMPEGFWAMCRYRLQANKTKIVVILALCVLLSLSAVTVWMMTLGGEGASKAAREQLKRARLVVSQANLHNLHITLLAYADSHGGRFPARLQDLPATMGISPELIYSATGELLGYVPGQSRSGPVENILVYTPARNGARTVLTIRGEITELKEQDFDRRLAVQQARRRPQTPATRPAGP